MTGRITFSVPLAMSQPDQMVPLARAAEAFGYDAVALPDAVFFPETASADYPYSADGARFWKPETPFVEPFLAIAAMAAVTERLRFYTNVYKLPLRNPLLVAKEVSSLAVLAGDRFEFGIGLAWIPEEFAYTQTDKSTRGKRVDEAIEIVRAVCAGGEPTWIEHHGEHYDFDKVMISPAPRLPVPILGSGHSAPALRRSALRCDGWISTQATLEELRRVTGELLAIRATDARSSEPFEVKALCTEAFDLDSFRRVATIEGVTDLQVLPWYFYGGDVHDLQVRIDALERFADEVVAPFDN
ncbi:MAG: TIGR03619 family F420-dependent LLM class oxidoreductase [Acidimicrobiia bacterium]|nr:TIGR03619 family F420-dependent LLM class oxidoreductase [Acidimicrobiia bacterium]